MTHLMAHLDIVPLILSVFWGIWHLIVAFTDFVNFLNQTYNANFRKFDSRNMRIIMDMYAQYGITSKKYTGITIVGVSLLCALAGISMFVGLYEYVTYGTLFWLSVAYIVTLLLHLLFIIVEEYFVYYEHITKHIVRILFILVSYYSIFVQVP